MGAETHGKDTGSQSNPLIAWGITGGEFHLREIVQFLTGAPFEFDLFLSRAAEELLNRYAMKDRLFEASNRVYHDVHASAPPIMRLFSGKYRLLVVAPATSNTVAKMVHGIADTLVTNMFAQAGKIRLRTIVLPTDHSEVQVFTTVSGRVIEVRPRKIDLENTERLATMEAVTVVKSIEELNRAISAEIGI